MSIKPETFFNLLSDETRLRCLSLLQQEGELCVCEFTYVLKMVQPKISRHLALLRKHKVVSDRRAGLWIYYRLNSDLPTWAKQTLEYTVKGIQQDNPYASDVSRLAKMPGRPTASCCPPTTIPKKKVSAKKSQSCC